MEHQATTTLSPRASCRAVVIWIDWYAYHLARFKGLQSAFGTNGEVCGIELVGGVGVHKGYAFREGMPQDMPVETLHPTKSWHEAGKLDLSWKLVQQLSRLNPIVVLVPGYYTLPAIAAALWCKAKGRTAVLMTESTAADHARKGWREKLKSWLIRSLFDWAVTGGAAHDRYLLQLGFPNHRIAHFYDVVGNARIEESVSELREQSSFRSHGLRECYFLFVGRLAPEKNAFGLLQAWLAYRTAGGSWSLVFAGDGPDGQELKRIAADSAYAEDVRFLGHRSARELLPIYAFAKCFVLPSTREPWGLVVNEAMAASLPVIVSNRCGCAEDLVEQGGNGVVFDPEKVGDLRDCLTLIASLSEEERLRKGKLSLQRISRFSPNNFGQEIVTIAEDAERYNGNGSSRAGSISSNSLRGGMRTEAGTLRREALSGAKSSADGGSSLAHGTDRWLHVLSHIDPVYGGLSAVVPRLANQLSTQEQIPTGIAAFCTPEEQSSADRHRENGLSVWPMRRSEWLLSSSLRERFRSQVASADGVHIHGVWESSTLLAASAARRAGVPYILSAHGMLESWALANKRLKKLIYAALIEHRNTSGAACLHALTHAEAMDYRRFGCMGPIAIIPNGVDAPSSADPFLFLERHPEVAGKRLLLFLGRIHYKKGIHLLLKAWAEIKDRHGDTVLVMAGPDSENTLSSALQLMEQLNLQDRVLFTGMLDAPLKWSALAAADFFVLPSYSEGLSVAALEALSMGVPLILSEQCNLPEVAQAGAGWLVRTNITDLAHTLGIALACTTAEHNQYRSQARALAGSKFSWNSVTQRMAQLYRWVGGGALPQNVELLRGSM